ncbi:ribokinase [Marinihelvus fidelis]|uniref:Ribokinase n=1 Tax=Marinihelvus fidelis TaxID=2613842 RepID=A0A5N0TCV2_9GAMM|nr:ribokinase [Marinihelvus fidelis]KAA9132581.1 ribokinase [Marinihelvus fidelis]
MSLEVAVIGSVNLDLVARVRAFPRPGETVTDATLDRHPGGKGGNQAIAIRRLGANVRLVACVGNDSTADEALAGLAREGVILDHVQRIDGAATGTAMIAVDGNGENQIVVAPGANRLFTPERLVLPACDVVIAQLEVPMDTLEAAARAHPGFFCLNAAPARPVSPALLADVDLLVVNEIEAEAIGPNLDNFNGWLAVTYGASGAELMRHGNWVASSDAPRVDAIDTVGAGDAFTAALAFGLGSGQSPDVALNRACTAGALATTRAGAQSSPTLEALEQFLARPA